MSKHFHVRSYLVITLVGHIDDFTYFINQFDKRLGQLAVISESSLSTASYLFLIKFISVGF